MKKPSLRWIERVLIVIGLVCVGVWAWSWIDAKIYQYRENRLLEEAASTRLASKAAETDSLGNLREATASAPPPREE